VPHVAGVVRLAPAVTRSLGERFIDSGGLPEQNAAHCLAVLTDREREVLALLARCLSNAEIAGKLYLSEGMVKTHVSHLRPARPARCRNALWQADSTALSGREMIAGTSSVAASDQPGQRGVRAGSRRPPAWRHGRRQRAGRDRPRIRPRPRRRTWLRCSGGPGRRSRGTAASVCRPSPRWCSSGHRAL